MEELLSMGELKLSLLALAVLAVVLLISWIDKRFLVPAMDEKTRARLQRYEDEQRKERLKPSGGVISLESAKTNKRR